MELVNIIGIFVGGLLVGYGWHGVVNYIKLELFKKAIQKDMEAIAANQDRIKKNMEFLNTLKDIQENLKDNK